MDFDLTPAQKALRDKAREVSLREIATAAADTDRNQRFPQAAIKRLGELGMLGVGIPTAWGGAGLDHVTCALVIEEIANACASTALVASTHNLLVCQPILRFGSEAQKREWLPALAAGAKLGCFAFAEAAGASTADRMVTKAWREGDGWVLRGSKSFVTAGPVAQCALVFAATPSGDDSSLSAFLVPTATAGVGFSPAHQKLGLRGAVTASMQLDDVRLAPSALLGGEGRGGEILGFATEGSRIGAAALALGIASAAFAAATSHAISRKTDGQPIAEHQTIQFMLAEMSTQIDAARLLTWRAASCRDAGGVMGAQASMAKLLAAQAATRASSHAMEIFGGSGCLTDFAVERHFRDAKVAEIYEGTNEFQRLGIASELLKE